MRRPVSLSLFLILVLWGQGHLRADGPADNIAETVRPVPPPGIAIDPAVRRELTSRLAELDRALQPLRAAPVTNPRLADVEIFHRAVSLALTDDGFFAEADLGRARRLLDVGLARAQALTKGRSPWLDTTGPTVLGYVSQLDGTPQPYGLWIPETYSRTTHGRFRLDTWFHGRGETLSEVNFVAQVLAKGGPFVRPDTFVIQPYGRYCNGSKLAGEVDFFEALADLKSLFPIDDDRIVIRGFSLGGASTWHLAAHHASLWAAAAPGAGFSETPEFLRMLSQNPSVVPARWERLLWQLYDAPVYAENFMNLPVVAYSGEIDKQKQAADVMQKALAQKGIALQHIIGPQTGHKYHPDAIVAINERIDALAAQGRPRFPRHVSLATPTLRYNRQAWVRVDGLSHHWEKATVDATWVDDRSLTVSTRGVTALTLDVGPGLMPVVVNQQAFLSPRVTIDGQRLQGPPVASDRSWTMQLRRTGSRWVPGADPAPALRKSHGLQGPIDDAFLSAFLVVTPSGEARESAVGQWAKAEQGRFVREWRHQFRGDARVKLDTEVTDDDIARYNLVLWGDFQSNRILARIADRLPFVWNQQEIVMGTRRFPARGHALIAIYPNPLATTKYVVLNSGVTFRNYDYINNANQIPKLPDWAIVDLAIAPNARTPGRIVDADFFDERWQLPRGR